MSTNSSLLPNPFTPLAFLPPGIAHQLEITRYCLAALVGAWLWDFFMCLHEDYRLFFKCRTAIVDVVYLFARSFTLAAILCSFIFLTGPVSDCSAFSIALGWCEAIAMPLNSLLFLFRVRAVFHKDKRTIIGFSLIWLLTLCSIAAPLGIGDASHVGTSSICVANNVKSFTPLGVVFTAFFDTTVYFSISVKLTMSNLAYTRYSWRELFKVYFGGQGMNTISRMLLKSGQAYYLFTVAANIAAMVCIFSPSVPPAVKIAPATLNIFTQNIMACKVHRRLKIGLISDNPMNSLPKNGSEQQPRSNPGNTMQMHKTKFQLICSMCQRSTVEGPTKSPMLFSPPSENVGFGHPRKPDLVQFGREGGHQGRPSNEDDPELGDRKHPVIL